jgi:hypothetical protein
MHPHIGIELAWLKQQERLTHAERTRATALRRGNRRPIEEPAERFAIPMLGPARGVTSATAGLIARVMALTS